MAPDWQRALVALSATVVTAAVIGAMYFARSVFVPVAMAVFLTFVLAPVVTRVQRIGIGRTLAVIATVGMVVLVSTGIGMLVTYQIGELADTLGERRDAVKEKLVAAKQWVVGNGSSPFGQFVDDVAEVVSPKPAPQSKVVVEPTTPPLVTQLETYASPAVEVLGQAALAFVLTIFMLLQREDLRNRAIRLFGDGQLTTTTKAVDDAARRISRYLLCQLIVNTAFGVIITLGLFALGVQYAILWGFIATLMRYVPYVGTWIGLIPAVVFSIATAPSWGGGWGQPFAVLALFGGLELFCNNVVEPKVYGRSMGLSEVAQLFMAALWAFLWGPVGLILSGPLTVCLLVLGLHVPRFNFLVVLLGDQPVLEPRITFYQRLTAHDQDEAAGIAEEVATADGVDAAFDTVIVPALTLARRDHAAGQLEAADLRFAIAAAREIAEELAEPKAEPTSEPNERARVLLCPARDKAEQVAAEMLAFSLDRNRWEVKVTPDDTLASELEQLVEAYQPDVTLIVALPPGGMAHARYLVARLRKRFPDGKVLVGRWDGDLEGVHGEDTIRHTDGIDRTLAGTRKRLSELLSLIAAKPVNRPQFAAAVPVGTATA